MECLVNAHINMSEIINDLENISEFLFNNSYNSWGNIIRKAIAQIKEQQLDIEALKNTIQSMVEGQCIIAGDKRIDVVLCKDCKHWKPERKGYCPYNHIFTAFDWFCADGERKDNDA